MRTKPGGLAGGMDKQFVEDEAGGDRTLPQFHTDVAPLRARILNFNRTDPVSILRR
jgi:hypothetical protein